MSELKVKLDDTYMPVIVFGHGEKNFVLLSGLSLCGLEGQGPGIEKAYSIFCDKYTVYVFDRKKVLKEGYTTKEMTEDIYRTLDLLGVKKASVMGVSHGGFMALELAANHPELVEKLVLCSTAPGPTPILKKVMKIFEDTAAGENVEEVNHAFCENVFSQKYLDSIKEALPALMKKGTEEDCRRLKVLAKACAESDTEKLMSKIKCPVLVIGDENDRVMGPEGSCDLQKKLNCELYMYKDYSHAVYDEAPDIKQRILDYLEK